MAGTDGVERGKRKGTNATGPTDAQARQENPAPAKRQRVSRACDQCRAAREKCDGIQPICFTCASSNRNCSYTANPKKRGIQPGYIRTLELALAWTFSNNPKAEDSLVSFLNQSDGRALLLGKDSDSSNKLHRKWRRSSFCKNIDKVLSGTDVAPDTDRPLSPTSPDDEKPDDDDFAADNSVQSPNGATQSLSLNPAAPKNFGDAASHLGSPSKYQGFEIRSSFSLTNPTKLRLPSNLWRLFDVYFAYTHSWFPIAEKHDILKISYSYPEEGLELSSKGMGTGDHAELWAILAIASVQECAATSNNSNPEPTNDNSQLQPNDIYNAARDLIPTEQGSHEIGHVKALLLLALVNIGADRSRAAWLQIGYAIRIGMLLGLHNSTQRADNFPFSEERNPREKHVFLACFALDTIVSAHLGREPILKREHVTRVGLLAEDGLEEWHPWVGCPDFKPSTSNPAQYNRSPVHTISTFNNIVRILTVINDVLRGSLDGHAASMHLQQWISSIPPSLKAVYTNQQLPAPTPTLFGLRLIYLLASMAFAVPTAVPVEAVVETLLRYANAFGTPAMLPIFSPMISLAGRSGAFEALPPEIRSKWTSLLTNYRSLWRSYEKPRTNPRGNNTQAQAANDSTLSAISSTSHAFPYPSPASQNQSSISASYSPQSFTLKNNAVDLMSPEYTQVLGNVQQQTGFPTRRNTIQSLAPPDKQPAASLTNDQPSSMERFTATSPNDLDALFDELATLEGPERLDRQPQFMQNLGFAPDMSLSDVLTPDYSGLDSVFGSFMGRGNTSHSGNLEPPVGDQRRPSEST
ncbi:fungal-specific transcription factor domain-containing protein [Phyllosticta citribraziliensis]|uniref:Fungal-specific transcription factor domain-containing protein n=1 Tax=Phyllosticta citribraziliensis TaxID=989973 RepID=A0ABR1LAE4_9PEZI